MESSFSPDYAEQEAQNSIYSNDMIDPNASQLIRWQEDLDPILLNLAHDLKSEAYNPDTKKFEKIKVLVSIDEKGNEVFEYLPPMLQDSEIHELISLLKPVITHNTMLGTHEVRKVGALTVELANEISFYLSRLISENKLSIAKASLIDSSISTLIFATLTRGVDNKERDYIKGSSKTINMFRNDTTNDKGKSIT